MDVRHLRGEVDDIPALLVDVEVLCDFLYTAELIPANIPPNSSRRIYRRTHPGESDAVRRPTHRVYASREGLYANTADRKPGSEDTGDHSVAAALRAAHAYTTVHIADTKTVAAIRVHRKGADPSTWKVTMPSSSALAAGKIYQALANHIGDLVTLANKLGKLPMSRCWLSAPAPEGASDEPLSQRRGRRCIRASWQC